MSMADAGEIVEYECEYRGCRRGTIATGYVGGPKVQHPLCDEHLKPEHHPPDLRSRLYPGEITAPCRHAQLPHSGSNVEPSA